MSNVIPGNSLCPQLDDHLPLGQRLDHGEADLVDAVAQRLPLLRADDLHLVRLARMLWSSDMLHGLAGGGAPLAARPPFISCLFVPSRCATPLFI